MILVRNSFVEAPSLALVCCRGIQLWLPQFSISVAAASKACCTTERPVAISSFGPSGLIVRFRYVLFGDLGFFVT